MPAQTIRKTRVQYVASFKELLNEDWRNLVYYGGRGSGKSYHAALALILRGRKKKLRVLCTREIQNTIKDSVHKLLKDIITTYDFNDYVVTNDSIVNRLTGTEFIFKGLLRNIMEIKSMEGIDVAWVEEAQSISEDSLKVLVPTIRKEGSQLIFTFNRVNELDPVFVKYVQHKPPKTYSLKVNYDVLDEVGLFPETLKLEMEQDRKNPETFAHVWLGEPMGQAELSILPRTSVIEAMQREVEGDGAVIVGVDVARMGGDRTVLWKRQGLKTLDYQVFSKLRTVQVCDAIEQFSGFDKEVEVRVDDTGVGGGVTDELMKRQYNVIAVNFGQVAVDQNKYPNWISEAWFHMGEVLSEAQLPFDSDLLMELTTRQWGQDNKGKRRVESKVDYKKRGFRSPDLADACIICYSAQVRPGILEYYRNEANREPVNQS